MIGRPRPLVLNERDNARPLGRDETVLRGDELDLSSRRQ